jgi:hypothetical protein
MSNRTPAAGLIAADRFPLPRPDDFLAEFLEDDALNRLVGKIISHYADFDVLTELNIRTLWQKDAGTEDGRIKLGGSVKQNNLTRYLAKVDWVIFVNLKAAEYYEFTNLQMEALLFHEISHIDVEEQDDGTLKLKKLPHDASFFTSEIQTYGAWSMHLLPSQNAFTQRSLWEDQSRGIQKDLAAHDQRQADRDAAEDIDVDPYSVDSALEAMQSTSDKHGMTTTVSWNGQSATIGPTKRTINGETFQRDDLGRYVNTETGEYLDAFEVPRPMTAGR